MIVLYMCEADKGSNKMTIIEEKKEKRIQFLRKLYEMSSGEDNEMFNMHQIGEELGFDRDLTGNIAEYLEKEGLTEFQTIGGAIRITHRGIREVEEA